jgi:hypothetical protein
LILIATRFGEIDLNTASHVLSLDSIRRETDFAHEAYCIECGFGGYVKGNDGLSFFFYESQGPFCNTKCFADFLGVEVEVLPPIKMAGRLGGPNWKI